MSGPYLLDTNVRVEVARRPNSLTAARLAAVPRGDILTPEIVVAELMFGAEGRPDPAAERIELNRLLAPARRLPFDGICVPPFARTRHLLERAGTPTGAYDLMIAATALAYGLTLVTHDAGFRHAARLCHLSLTDWQVP